MPATLSAMRTVAVAHRTVGVTRAEEYLPRSAPPAAAAGPLLPTAPRSTAGMSTEPTSSPDQRDHPPTSRLGFVFGCLTARSDTVTCSGKSRASRSAM